MFANRFSGHAVIAERVSMSTHPAGAGLRVGYFTSIWRDAGALLRGCVAPGLQFRVAPADAGEADHRSAEHHQGAHHRSARRKRRSSGEKATTRRVKKPQFDLQRASTTDRRSRSGVGRTQLARALQGRWVRAQNTPSPKRAQGRPSMLRVNCCQRAALAMFFRFEKIEPVLLSSSFHGG